MSARNAAATVCGLLLLGGCSAAGSPEGGGLDPVAGSSGGGSVSTAGSGGGSAQSGSGGGPVLDVPMGGMAPDDDDDCSPKIVGLLRDYQTYRGTINPVPMSALETCPVYGDFQAPWTVAVPGLGNPEKGIPMMDLGPDSKPVFSGGSFQTITSADTFNAWYRDDPKCNQTFEHEIMLTPDPATGNSVFDSSRFFPLDGLGYGLSGRDDQPEDGHNEHNFHFTFELHMTFKYNSGDIFSFRGDDDLFVFINKKLVIDLGGAHAPMDASVELDSLGLEAGKEYPIDFFHAERAASQSNFHIETSLQFTNCKPIIVR
jgi:fibro-slime domain-containing protein